MAPRLLPMLSSAVFMPGTSLGPVEISSLRLDSDGNRLRDRNCIRTATCPSMLLSVVSTNNARPNPLAGKRETRKEKVVSFHPCHLLETTTLVPLEYRPLTPPQPCHRRPQQDQRPPRQPSQETPTDLGPLRPLPETKLIRPEPRHPLPGTKLKRHALHRRLLAMKLIGPGLHRRRRSKTK